MPGNFYVTVTKTGKDPEQWIKEVSDKIHFELQNEIKLSAEATAEIMKRILLASGYNLNKLADAINAEVINSIGGIEVGIGKISDLPVGQESGASYWEAFNDGFKVTQANIGYFGDNFRAPESGGSGEKWHHTGKGSGFFLMKPYKVIEPLKYIDIGYDELKKHIEKQINKFMAEIGGSTIGGHVHGWGMGAGGAK